MNLKKILLSFVFLVIISGFVSARDHGRDWEIHLIHHTHVDIGFTHPQDDVMKKQWRNLESAMALVEKTSHMPEAARFKWNPEVTWALEEWLKRAGETERTMFVRQVQRGSIGLDSMFANMLTGLCRPEELMRVFSYKRYLEKITGVKIDSAMITDVPGWSWGFVTALDANGIKYLSIGPNRLHRIGYVRSDWGDRPFYWASPSGDEKVLCFIHGKGYSWFHTPATLKKEKELKNKFTPRRVFRYLRKLERDGYPYDIVPIRYAIGSDNGPPDPDISRIVKEWNEKYPDVKVKLSTVSATFSEFEKRYGDRIPVYRGDFSPYWSDGAASTARETAMVRNAAEKLTQAQTLWALFDKNTASAEKFYEAWKAVLLFNEHTWGAYNSISDPDSDFARRQWEWKKRKALDADAYANTLMAAALNGIAVEKSDGRPAYIDVINTHSWDVTGPVKIETGHFPGAKVETADGQKVPAQIMSDGSLLFVAESVPAMSSKKFIVESGNSYAGNDTCRVTENSISNGIYEITFNGKTGTISSIRKTAGGWEYVNDAFHDGFNEYIYIKGRRPERGRKKIENPQVSVTVKEKGPLVCAVELKRDAFNSKSLTTTITMYGGLDRIDLVNTLDRPVVRGKEGIHFAFPVNAQNPKVRYDVAWGAVEVDVDQMKGANRNFMTALRWVDVSGDEAGMQFVLRDAPLFEAGDITMDAFFLCTEDFVYKWLRETKHNGAIYSYVMNNYWETNYKADQPGITSFRYSMFPHGNYNAAENNKRALEVVQPLPAVHGRPANVFPPPLIKTGNENIIIEAAELSAGDGSPQLRLYNVSDAEEVAVLNPGEKCRHIFLMEDGHGRVPLDGREIKFGAHDIVRLVCAD